METLKRLNVKICGMRDPENIREISRLDIDFMGFIYYPHSKRFAAGLSAAEINDLPEQVKTVGVFVNMPVEALLFRCSKMKFAWVQLHGNESVEYCRSVQRTGLRVIKAFGIGNEDDFEPMKPYQECCDLFLLDTSTTGYGGSGRKFNWNLLSEYRLEKPFFLGGGIGPKDIDRIRGIDHPGFYGVDLNSKFESEPGLKNRDELEAFIRGLRADRR